MIISCSRRTDIPAYYSDWLINRLTAGYCHVPNPYNPTDISRVDISPAAIKAIVFWTRNASPLLPHIDFINKLNYKYYFLHTINNYSRHYELNRPTAESAISTFRRLSGLIGSGRCVWRYDPVFFSEDMNYDFHLFNFKFLCSSLKGATNKVITSVITSYRKTLQNLPELNSYLDENSPDNEQFRNLFGEMAAIAESYGMVIEICSSDIDFSNVHVKPARCIDDRILRDELGIDLVYQKDKNQRPDCGCMVSKDIGMNNTCPMGCRYCYATSSHETAQNNRKKHDPAGESLLPLKNKNKHNEIQGLFDS